MTPVPSADNTSGSGPRTPAAPGRRRVLPGRLSLSRKAPNSQDLIILQARFHYE